MIELRPYQAAAIAAIRGALTGPRSTLLVLPTGCGKTIVFAEIVKRVVARGGRALVLAHRRELLSQAAAKIERLGVWRIGVEKGATRSAGEPVVVASVQTLRGRRLESFAPDAFNLVVVDEAHHAVSNSYRRVLEWFAGAKVLGVTATPDRLDRLGLGQVFDSVAYQYELRDAIRDGWLVPIHARAVEVAGLDLSGVRTTAGDLNRKDLAAALTEEHELHAVAAPLVDLAGDRRTVVFTVDVDHARQLAEVIDRYRPGAARWISGKTGDRERTATVEAFARGEFQFLANCALLTEGWDDPGIECVALARPTKSRALYAQMIGRGTRLHPGKTDVLVLDFVGNAGRHRLITAADVLAGRVLDDDEVAAVRSSDIDDTLGALDQALADIAATKRKLAVTAVASFIAERIDPFLPPDGRPPAADSGEAPGQIELLDRAATPRQLELLDRHGIKLPVEASAEQAADLLDRLRRRHNDGLATFKQVRLLAKMNCPRPDRLTKPEATRRIARDLARRRQWSARR